MGFLERDRPAWEPPAPSLPLVVHCPAEALPAARELIESEEDRPLRVGDEVEASVPGCGTWRLEVAEGAPLPDPPPTVWRPPEPPGHIRERLGGVRFQVLVELRDPGPDVAEAVLFGTTLADRLAELAEGVVHDREAVRVYGPGDWRIEEPDGAAHARDHVTFHVIEGETPGGAWIHTHGLRKFGRPELEVYDVPPDLAFDASWSFCDLAAYLIGGELIRPGETLGDPERPIGIKVGGRDREHWGEVPALELVDVDERGALADTGASRGLAAWARSDPGG